MSVTKFMRFTVFVKLDSSDKVIVDKNKSHNVIKF